jgi:quercetin dioxygenase-like cupin family protein
MYDDQVFAVKTALPEAQLKAIVKATLLVFCLSLAIAAQTDKIISLSSEPHHHLALHNEYVNVYNVEVAAHDSVLLHRHDFDAISIMLKDAQVTVYTPGQPEARRKLIAGQLRLQPGGYVHSTTIDGDTTYRNVTVELLVPQHGEHNLCLPVIPGQPLHCPDAEPSQSGKQVQFESNETSISMVALSSHQKSSLAQSDSSQLVIALDHDLLWQDSRPTGPQRTLKAGDFIWLDGGKAPGSLQNDNDQDSHIAVFSLKPVSHP